MKRLIYLLALLFMAASVCSGQTFNTWNRGYTVLASCTTVAVLDSVDMYAPVAAGDTVNVRGIMLGFNAIAHGHNHTIQIMYREAGADGWYRWNEWVNASPSNYGLPLPSKWQGIGGTNSMGHTEFLPIANIRQLRLYNWKAEASMHVVVLWFMDPQAAKAADWSGWEM